ncbi:MAG TPA: GTP cyclohydrolase MptA [Ktedonobacteraceae bacterium]|jgi:GTP cyclohydrolase-4|nr:GTP cyclohydrolase MptA [Ktedonobacteraceae bacterium]
MSIDTTVSPPFSQNGHKPAATHTVYLALGSNIGDRRGNLAAALQRLREVVEITAISSIYETEPVGYLDQPRFFNIVIAGKTSLSAPELLKYAKDIEVAIGRQPSFRNGPRPIDIDIIFYDDLHITEGNLTIPHPRMAERAFVLVPLAEIAPGVVDAATGHTAQELLDAVSQEGVKKLAPDLRISLEHDIQNSQPTVHVRLGRAGVVGVTKAILIGSEGNQQWFNATFDLYADLDSRQAGVHMSRFSDALDEVMEGIDTTAWPKIEILAEHIAKTIVEKQKAFRTEVHIRTAYPLQRWTPVSGRPTQEVYGLMAQAVATQDSSRRMIGVEVEGMVACPCAQDMVHSFARVRLQEEGFAEDVIDKMLTLTPLATHNQRGRATLMIGTDENLDAADLIGIAESAMSSENYGLLKRPDELYIVNKAHANPRFVEDVAREILRAVVEKYTNMPDETFIWVRQRNQETIHKYDVEAEGWGTLGELRAEILRNVRLERHTTKEEWLGIVGSTR